VTARGEERPGPVAAGPGGGRAQREVLRAAAVVGAATLLSRILGFVRDLVVARAFGAGTATDAFFVAFRIPNLLRRLLAEGALSSAFIPVFTEYLTTRSHPELVRMLRAVAGGLGAVLVAVTVLGMLGSPLLVSVMAPGFTTDPATASLTTRLTRLMFPYLFLIGLAAVAMGILNAHRVFWAPALSPVALNVGMIAAVWLIAPRLAEPIVSLGIGVLAGGVGQFLIQMPSLVERRLLVRPSLEPRHPAVRRILRLMGPVAIGQSATHLSTFINTVIASFLAGGSVSYLYFADRLVEFPLGVFGIAIATAALPTLSEQAARRDPDAIRETLAFALRLSGFVSLPAAVGLFILREPLVRVLYERGAFGAAETTATALALGCYALGLLGFAIAKVGAQAFYALGDTRTPVKVATAAMALNTVMAAALAVPLAHAGLALATSAGALAHAAALIWLLRRRLPGPAPRATRVGWTRIVAVSAALALGLVLALRYWPPPADRVAEGVWLGVLVMGGTLFYGTLQLGLGSDEARLIWGAVARRLPRRFLPGR
jgi:putative peptidoglycan lipid II flippase